MSVKHMRHKAPMGPKRLSRHSIGHAIFLLRHIANMIPLRIRDHIFIRLFEADHDIHHFQLSLNDQPGVGQ